MIVPLSTAFEREAKAVICIYLGFLAHRWLHLFNLTCSSEFSLSSLSFGFLLLTKEALHKSSAKFTLVVCEIP